MDQGKVQNNFEILLVDCDYNEFKNSLDFQGAAVKDA